MRKMIISNKDETMFFEKDGILSSSRDDAKIFTSEKEAENKSIDLQLIGSPVCWIVIL